MDWSGGMINAAVALGQMIAGTTLSGLGLAWESRMLRREERQGSHWTLKARAAWPARVTAGVHVFLIPAFLCLFRDNMGVAPEATLPWWLEGLAAMLGTMLGAYPLEKKLFPGMPFRSWTHHLLAGWGVRLITAFAFLACADSMPTAWSWDSLQIASIYLGFHLFCQFGGVLAFLRAVRFVVPADSALAEQVDAIASRAGIRVRKVWIMESVLANAMAFITTRELLFTRRLLHICTRDEIDSVCGHELAHLSESRWVIAGRLLTGLVWMPFLFLKPALGQHGITGLFAIGLSTMLIAHLGRRLSLSMEHRADAAAAGAQISEGIYAAALEKIHEASLIPAVLPGKGITHPHLYDRMQAAGVTPSYPRPDPPPRYTLWRTGLAILFGFYAAPWLGRFFLSHT